MRAGKLESIPVTEKMPKVFNTETGDYSPLSPTCGQEQTCGATTVTRMVISVTRKRLPLLCISFFSALLLLVLSDVIPREQATRVVHTTADRQDSSTFTFTKPKVRDNTVTVVTGYFNIGEIPATSETNHKYPELYHRWLRFFRNVMNPTIGYFDDPKAADIFKNVRQGLPTAVVMVNQSTMWAFSLADRIQKIIDRPDYPKHVPNTVYAKYDCATHAKLEVVQHAIRLNKFGTANVAWLDVGEFRDLAESNDEHRFYLGTPVDYDDTMVAFDEVRPMQNLSIEQIMKDSPVWVSASLFLAKMETMDRFVNEYKRFTLAYLDRGLANAEQCVMMAMYCPQNSERPTVGIQAYPYDSRYDKWFSLGYVLREQYLAKETQKRSKKFL